MHVLAWCLVQSEHFTLAKLTCLLQRCLLVVELATNIGVFALLLVVVGAKAQICAYVCRNNSSGNDRKSSSCRFRVTRYKLLQF